MKNKFIIACGAILIIAAVLVGFMGQIAFTKAPAGPQSGSEVAGDQVSTGEVSQETTASSDTSSPVETSVSSSEAATDNVISTNAVDSTLTDSTSYSDSETDVSDGDADTEVSYPADFKPYVDPQSPIVGKWKETSTDAKVTWTFFDVANLHITTTTGSGSSRSVICSFNYDDESGVLQYYVYSSSNELLITYDVEITSDTMTLTNEEDVVTLTKI